MNRQTTAQDARRTRSDGDRSRLAILDAAAAMATVQGLDGLSIGDLATRTGMSKSGLYAHFRSKEELQLATIDHAVGIFDEQVVRPAHATGEGVRLLWALVDSFLDHLERHVFPGGCFFASVGAEFDSRPGRVKERIVAFAGDWMSEIVAAVAQAQQAGELDASVEAEQLAWEVDALLLMAHAGFVMTDDPATLHRSRLGIERLLGAAVVRR